MKSLLTFIFLISCGGSVNNTPIEDLSPDENNNTISTQSMAFEYEKKIDIFVAFLWPMKIETRAAQASTQNILELGRSLRTGNEELLGATLEFKNLRCEQIFSGEIVVDYEVEEYCYEVEEKRLNLTALMLEKVTEMKSEINSIGGEWLDSNQDFENAQSSIIDFDNNTLSIFSLGSKLLDGEKTPLPYEKLPFQIKSESDYSFIEIFFPRIDSEGIYKVKADLSRTKNSLIFQGDLNFINNGVIQRGIIYWQILKKSSLL